MLWFGSVRVSARRDEDAQEAASEIAPIPGPPCPKCRTRTQEGFALDRYRDSTYEAAEWIEGRPAYGFLGMRLWGRSRFPIKAYRCPACGFLELYAKP
jgi:hypothetical protein